ncbi:hypothetical protein CFP56_019100 [Quercus suber]|uniref:Uncharacterized protein n=1 Tax=Quercus suber TaxID=58331 RepID=A0AAW0M011_QUESU
MAYITKNPTSPALDGYESNFDSGNGAPNSRDGALVQPF